MDTVGNKIAASEIAQIKVFAPNVVLKLLIELFKCMVEKEYHN